MNPSQLLAEQRKNQHVLESYRKRARKLAVKCPGDAERLLREIDFMEEMLQFKRM